MPTQALPPRHNDEKSQGSHTLRAPPQLTLPCTMTGVRWPSPPPPINTRGGGAERKVGKKERENEGKPRERERVFERERKGAKTEGKKGTREKRRY